LPAGWLQFDARRRSISGRKQGGEEGGRRTPCLVGRRYYNKPTPGRDVITPFKAVNDAIRGIPIIIYNIPAAPPLSTFSVRDHDAVVFELKNNRPVWLKDANS